MFYFVIDFFNNIHYLHTTAINGLVWLTTRAYKQVRNNLTQVWTPQTDVLTKTIN